MKHLKFIVAVTVLFAATSCGNWITLKSVGTIDLDSLMVEVKPLVVLTIYQNDMLPEIYSEVYSKVAESLLSASVTETMVADICRFFDEYYMSITRSSVAERFNVNPSYLSQSFSRLKGISFIDYVTEVRVKNAKRLLKTTNMKVQVVSEEVGYNSTQHFSKVFEKAVGISPAEYRRREQV